MDFHFNLLDEPWIPCAGDGLASLEMLSLRAVLLHPTEVRRIVDPRPTVTIALHRVLLALLHRALDGPRTREEWLGLWQRQAWDVIAYLNQQQRRFDLFDANYPFYQTPRLPSTRAVAVSTLAHDRASNVNSPMIFDHQMEGAGVPPAEAACWLLGQQQFSTPGLISDDGPSGKTSASGSPLMGALVCMAQGHNLFETLMLNLVRYDPEHELPCAFRGDDRPVWERDPMPKAETRSPQGYADWLTWPSRRILLVPECDAEGNTIVRRTVLMDGARTPPPPEFAIEKTETMVAYRKNPQADASQSKPPFLAMRFREDRAIWRESDTLLNGVVGQHDAIGPQVLEVVTKMKPPGLSATAVVPLMVAGVSNDQKMVVNWCVDALAVSPQLLQLQNGSPGMLFTALKDALKLAETMGELLLVKEKLNLGPQTKLRWSPMKVLVTEYAKGLGERSPPNAATIAEHLDSRRDYWAALALPFHRFLRELATTDETTGAQQRDDLRRQWIADVTTACEGAFHLALQNLDNTGESARALRACAIAADSFRQCCIIVTNNYQKTWEGDEA